MRLRTQLGLFFAGMAGIALALGAFTVWGGSRLVDTFSHSLKDMEKVSQVRSLQVLIARQKASLDAYFLLADPQELDRFDELGRLVLARLRELESMTGPGDVAVKTMRHRYDLVLGAVKEVIGLYQTDKNRAIAKATDDILPKVRAFFDSVNQAEAQMAGDVYGAQNRVRHLVKQVGQWILGLGLLGALLGFWSGFAIYRSLTRSLRALQEGTAAFGAGKWDYRIDLSARNELGQLAKSFNEMANNIKQLEMQTVHMHRMSAVGQLAGGVAHEINNPLTGVLGQAQLLLEKLPADDSRRSHIEKIERAALRCRRIVRSLLDFSRQKETQFSELNVNEAVDATLDLCEPDLQSGRVAVVKELHAGVPPVMGNSSQLQQVFLNLVSNAVQAMPEGGTLTIGTRLTGFNPPGGLDDARREAVEIRFTDTGSGILSEHLSHVFEPFFTTKEIGKGTGLGLSVSLGIARNHGGDIRAESAGNGKGATFRVFLPTAAVAAASAAPPVAGVAARAGGEAPLVKGPNPRY